MSVACTYYTQKSSLNFVFEKLMCTKKPACEGGFQPSFVHCGEIQEKTPHRHNVHQPGRNLLIHVTATTKPGPLGSSK